MDCEDNDISPVVDKVDKNKMYIDEKYIMMKCGELVNELKVSLISDIENKVRHFIEHDKITRDDSFTTNGNFDLDKMDERLMLSLEEQIKFLKEELKNKNEVIKILLSEKTQNNAQHYKSSNTHKMTENFETPKRTCRSPPKIVKNNYKR